MKAAKPPHLPRAKATPAQIIRWPYSVFVNGMSFRNFYRTLGMMQWQGIKILVLRSVDLQLHSLYPYIIICYNAKAGIK